jgi:hypothetical protein
MREESEAFISRLKFNRGLIMSKAMCMLKWTGKYLFAMIACIVGFFAFALALFVVSMYIADLLNIRDFAILVMIIVYFMGASVSMAYLKCYTTYFDKKSAS